MHWDASTYDDDRELTDYVWHNYSHLLTRQELKVWNAVILEHKAEAASEKMARFIRERLGPINDPDVTDALRNDFAAYQRAVRERILSQHPNEVAINRCARCSRIVARPKSRQCLWCGHDWHERGGVST
jgi:hypothetical protein